MVNGKLIVESAATLSVKDLSVLRGYGIFDFFRTDFHRPLFLEDHLQRLQYSSAKVFPDHPLDMEDVKKQILDLLSINKMAFSGIRIVRTGGETKNGYDIGNPNLIITQESISFPSSEKYQNGVKLISHEFQRELVDVKTISYMTGIWLQPLVKKHNAYDIVYHQNRNISELTRSNFFIVDKHGVLVTPPSNILKGITRKKVLQIANDIMEVEERQINLAELAEVQEAFLTGTTKKVLPVVEVDDMVIGNGRPGERTKELMLKFEQLEKDYFKQ